MILNFLKYLSLLLCYSAIPKVDTMEEKTSSIQVDVNERSIILQCQHGDKQAYGKLVIKYMKQAYFIALGIVGSHDNALDLSQEAFVKAFKAINKFDPDKKFFTWYYRILRNLCFNFQRDKSRRARPFSEFKDEMILEIADNSQDSLEDLEKHELKKIVWDALAQLKEHDREIIMMKDFQDLSYKQIAEILDCPMGTVMSRLYNARKALKIKLEGILI